MVGLNTRGIQDQDSIISRAKDFLLHNPNQNKCFKVVIDKPELLQCGPGGTVSFERSEQPDPDFKRLKRNPGSVENPAENSDPCGPLLPDNVPFMFKKDSPLNELILSYKVNYDSPYIDSITV